jgi:hypothetical protein
VSSQAERKRAQRKRRKTTGLEQVSAFVPKPALVALLIWEGHLDKSVYDLPPKFRKVRIEQALGDYLIRLSWGLSAGDEPPPKHATGSFGAEAMAMRHLVPWRKKDVLNPCPQQIAGLLQREGEIAEAYGLSPIFLITRRNAALRQAVTPDESISLAVTSPEGAGLLQDETWFSWHGYEDGEPPRDDYDPVTDFDESRHEHEEEIESHFDSEGFESD